MDYKTKPTSREELRGIARFIRKLFKCKNKYRFDVMDAFERIPVMLHIRLLRYIPIKETI